MSMAFSNRTPEQIAFEINSIKEESGKMLLKNAVEIGRRLTEAKELVPHGEWLNWLTESVSYSRSTASRLMKTFREYSPILASPDWEENPNGAPVHHLNYTQGLMLFGIPLEEREQFIADNDVENMSKRELGQAIKERSQTPEEENLQAPETQETPVRESLVEVVGEADKGIDISIDKSVGKLRGPIPVQIRIIRPKTVQTALPTVSTHPDILKFNDQFTMHRDNMLNAYGELLKILVDLNRADPVEKEAKRKEALTIATNMVETLKQYPPEIKTNLNIKRDKV